MASTPANNQLSAVIAVKKPILGPLVRDLELLIYLQKVRLRCLIALLAPGYASCYQFSAFFRNLYAHYGSYSSQKRIATQSSAFYTSHTSLKFSPGMKFRRHVLPTSLTITSFAVWIIRCQRSASLQILLKQHINVLFLHQVAARINLRWGSQSFLSFPYCFQHAVSRVRRRLQILKFAWKRVFSEVSRLKTVLKSGWEFRLPYLLWVL